MAKKKDGEEAAEGGGKKKLIMAVVGLLVGAFVAKTFFLKPPPPTPEEAKLAAKTEKIETWRHCAEINHVTFDVAAAEAEFETWWAEHGGADHAAEPGAAPAPEPSGAEEQPAPAEGEGHSAPVTTGARSGGLGLMAAARPVAGGGGGAMHGPPVLEVDSITVNLAGDHYLKVGLGLELVEGVDAEMAKTHGLGLPARDLLIRELSNRPMEELRPADVRMEIQRKIGYELCKERPEEIRRAYFTDFVMQ
ncbi:MAG: hypothetical protein KatS3mg010_0698 [Acidimicrobiia bacterium]|nr:MAG: hypothetical protein KatS3mg010_0698 [Acidimicrobiia bacterium]